ncbi:MAG: PadR family transcriptional regulator [Holophagales bacterium]|nr:PadR family transcriptional regulator [Holophagales bacterium]
MAELSKDLLLSDLEYAISLVLLRQGDQAYGVSIREDLARRAGRRVSLGAIYTTLDRLDKKGLVVSRAGDPTPRRGGRRKRLCGLTPAGERALAATWDAQQRLARGLEPQLSRFHQQRLPREAGDA